MGSIRGVREEVFDTEYRAYGRYKEEEMEIRNKHN